MTKLTGLSDSYSNPIKVGNKIKITNEINHELHGAWVVYEVIQKGLTPVVSYLYSEKGQIFPEGHSAGPLCNEYDLEQFVFEKEISKIKPTNEIVVVE